MNTQTEQQLENALIAQLETLGWEKVSADVNEAFDSYWTEEKRKALIALSEEEGLDQGGLEKVLGNYLFTEKTPLRDEIIGIMETRPSLRERGTVAERVIDKIKG